MRKRLALSIVILGVLLFSGNALADVYTYGVQILEQPISSYQIKFTVTNNTDELLDEYGDPLDENVVAFAVGNNSAEYTTNSNAWFGTQAYYDTESGCEGIWCYGDYSPIDWLASTETEEESSFNYLPGYTHAFYFDFELGEGSPVSVSPGTSLSGFFGYLEGGPMSKFAALLGDGSVVTGETAIPIPGAIWLLGSGLIGIVGIRRKFRK